MTIAGPAAAWRRFDAEGHRVHATSHYRDVIDLPFARAACASRCSMIALTSVRRDAHSTSTGPTLVGWSGLSCRKPAEAALKLLKNDSAAWGKLIACLEAYREAEGFELADAGLEG